jgi:hypothetical protein
MGQQSTRTVAERIEEAMREIGVLLVAFTPLDAAFTPGAQMGGRWLLFLLIGILLFAMALLMERIRDRG